MFASHLTQLPRDKKEFSSSFHTFPVLSLSKDQFGKWKLVNFRVIKFTLELQQNRENSIKLKNIKLIPKGNETTCYSLRIPALIQSGNPLVLCFLQIIPDKMELLSIFYKLAWRAAWIKFLENLSCTTTWGCFFFKHICFKKKTHLHFACCWRTLFQTLLTDWIIALLNQQDVQDSLRVLTD